MKKPWDSLADILEWPAPNRSYPDWWWPMTKGDQKKLNIWWLSLREVSPWIMWRCILSFPFLSSEFGLGGTNHQQQGKAGSLTKISSPVYWDYRPADSGWFLLYYIFDVDKYLWLWPWSSSLSTPAVRQTSCNPNHRAFTSLFWLSFWQLDPDLTVLILSGAIQFLLPDRFLSRYDCQQ